MYYCAGMVKKENKKVEKKMVRVLLYFSSSGILWRLLTSESSFGKAVAFRWKK